MPGQVTIEQADIDEMVAMLKDKAAPVPLEDLVVHYIARLKERVTAETEAAPGESA
jgi:hypothetical protein